MPTRKKRMKWMGTILLCLGTCCPASWSKTQVVGKPGTPCPNATYTTIAAAINAADPGDVIEVCPALYTEQLLIAKPLTLRGIDAQGIGRVLIRPTQLLAVGGLSATAVITVINTSGVSIQNLAIDASNNTVAGCTITLAGIHFFNASGTVESSAISGARLSNPLSCPTLFPGNGFGVQADKDPSVASSPTVAVRNTSIHDFSRSGILVSGPGEKVYIEGNSIAGAGPASGVFQFGVMLANGATGRVTGNDITQGTCGAIPILDCFDIRSEGVVLRSTGDGVVIEGNTISNVQAGIFVNGATNVRVVNNEIRHVDALSGIHIQGSTGGLFMGNRIVHVGPFTLDTSNDEEGCGINDTSGSGSSANIIQGNWVNDAYCGVAYVTSDLVHVNFFQNTLFETLNGDNYPEVFPPPVQPGQPASTASLSQVRRRLRSERQ